MSIKCNEEKALCATRHKAGAHISDNIAAFKHIYLTVRSAEYNSGSGSKDCRLSPLELRFPHRAIYQLISSETVMQ